MSAQRMRAEEQAAPYLVAPLLTDHLDAFSSAPEGFKRLREFVLNLAVRGRLVPQDANDEPAKKLLERIRSTRSRVTTIAEDSEPYELPPSWAWTTLGEITNIGETIKAGILQNDIWVLDLEDIEKDTSKITRKVRFSERQSKSDKNVFSAGDVLYGKLRPYLNKVIVADEHGVCTTEILPLRGYESIDANYIKTFLKSPGFIEYVNEKSYGMKMPRLGTTDAKQAYFALPPLAEQSRIVAKVEELMALIDAMETKVSLGETALGKLLDALLAALADSPDAVATADAWAQLAPHFDLLLQTPADVDRLQQTLLTLAVKGRLVPQDPNDEPASELLKSVCTNGKFLVAPVEAPYELPSHWKWVQVAGLCSLVTDGEHATPPRIDDRTAVPLVTAKNVRDGVMDYANTDFVPQDVAEKCWRRCKPQKDDILMVSVGATLGRLTVLRDPIEMVLVRSVTVLRPIVSIISPDYIALHLRSPGSQAEIWSVVRQSAQPCLYLAKSSALKIALPPLAEQSRIVAAVASLTALCDRLRERLAARRALSAKLATALTESILT